MKIKNVCCIIVTYNIGISFYKCFNSIYNQVDKVIVVDNGSDKNTIKVLNEIEKEYKDITIVYNKENQGIATALNQGIQYAISNNYEWVLTMDNDSEATNNMVNTMKNVYESINLKEREDIISIFPSYIEKGYEQYENIKESDSNNFEFDFVEAEITSGNMVKTNVFKDLGLLEEKLFIDLVDVEICLRLLKNNLKMIKVKGAILLHSLGNSTKRKILTKEVAVTNHSALRRYYITRNRLEIWKMYKGLECQYLRNSKKDFIKEALTLLLFEKDKISKFKAIRQGVKDYRNNIFGKKII
ncbi:glycosyltransferase [Clostridium gasigenes]|uniref:Glycosyltransferase n=1 Tax=Clostridium gasigenes TaxID=94869 RepID=A0A7X0VPR0_9CLOT|nr:glycosyltransferase [Clostridium gasigenes]MBB6713519.1 glycosyltransferase [Clostridium gasigenes]